MFLGGIINKNLEVNVEVFCVTAAHSNVAEYFIYMLWCIEGAYSVMIQTLELT